MLRDQLFAQKRLRCRRTQAHGFDSSESLRNIHEASALEIPSSGIATHAGRLFNSYPSS